MTMRTTIYNYCFSLYDSLLNMGLFMWKRLLFFLIPLALQSSPVGGSATSQIIGEGFVLSRNSIAHFRLGYEGDFVEDGKLDQVRFGKGRVDAFCQRTNSGLLTLNFLDRLDLFGGAGSSYLSTAFRFIDPDEITNRVQIDTFHRPLLFVGAKGTLFEKGPFSLGMATRFATARYQPSLWMVNGEILESDKTRLQWDHCQVSLDLSYKVNILTPYIGMKYSSSRVKFHHFTQAIAPNNSTVNRMEQKEPVGFFLGMLISSGKLAMLSAEFRFLDEESWTISSDFRF